jgi:hypothetical protein
LREPYWALNVSEGERMRLWAELAWGSVFGVAALAVSFNFRDLAWRIHGFMANTVGVSWLMTPVTVRVTCGVLAAASLVSVAVGPVQSLSR